MRIAIASDNRRRFTNNEYLELRRRDHDVRYIDRHKYPTIVQVLKNYEIVWADFLGARSRRYSWTAPKVDGARLVVRVHAPRELRSVRGIHWQGVACAVFDSPAIRDQALRLDKALRRCRTEVIRLSVDTSMFYPFKNRKYPDTVGLLGMVRGVKSIEGVLRTLGALRKRGIKYKFLSRGYLGGETQYMLHLERMAKRLGVPCQFSPWCGSLDRHYKEGDPRNDWLNTVGVILSNSKHEGTHLAIAEGLSAQCFGVVRAWPGAKFLYPRDCIYGDGKTSLADQLKWYYKLDQRKRAQWGAQMRQFAVENFGVQAVVDKLESLFQELVS